MPRRPITYDEIRRATVPSVDMFRPDKATREPTAPERELVRRVRAALDGDPQLDARRIDVRAHGSRIFLTGTAPGPGTAAYAVDIAAAVDGVSDVSNELGIDPAGR